MQQPLIPSPETRADYGARYAARRVRVLRFVVAFFVLAIIVGAVLTTIRLNHIASRQVYIDNSFPACRKGYALGAYTEPESGDRRLLVWSGKADNNCMWSNELCDDTWLFDANVDSPLNGTSKWTHIDKENDGAYLQSNKRPEPRWKTIAVQDEAANMYIFAGDPLRANGAFIDDVWKLDAATMRWEQLAPTCEDLIDTEDACNALPRRAHAAAYMRGSIYMHGGKNEASDLLNDMWSLNLRTMRWTLLHDGSDSEVAKQRAPPARKGHTLVAVDSLVSSVTGKSAPAIVLFAGRVDDNTYFNDVWSFFPSQARWEQLDGQLAKPSLPLLREGGATPGSAGAHGLVPHPRDHHAAAVSGDAMYTYGGWYQYWHAFDDIWRFDLTNRSWTAIAPVGVTVPPGRFLISLLPLGHDLYMFGGELGSDQDNLYRNDVWAFSTQTLQWTELSPSRCPRDHSVVPRPPRASDADDEDDGELPRRAGPPALPTHSEKGSKHAKGGSGEADDDADADAPKDAKPKHKSAGDPEATA